MVNKRMTGKNYHREYKELLIKLESLKVHIEARLLDLIEKYPEGVAVHKGGDPLLCKHITKIWFQDLSLEGKIRYIENIERWSEEQQGAQQLKLE